MSWLNIAVGVTSLVEPTSFPKTLAELENPRMIKVGLVHADIDFVLQMNIFRNSGKWTKHAGRDWSYFLHHYALYIGLGDVLENDDIFPYQT